MSSAGSPGPSTSNSRDVALIFDLDGTILSVNSFKIWVMHMLAARVGGHTAKQRLALSVNTALLLAKRKAFRTPHGTFKRGLQQLWAQALARDAQNHAQEALSKALFATVRESMKPLLQQVREGKVDALLATAAADEYARYFGQQLGFAHIITTPPCQEGAQEGAFDENSRARKRDRSLEWLKTHGLESRQRIFFTDHEEDLPLIRESDVVFWFGAADEVDSIRERAKGGSKTPDIRPALNATSLHW